MATAEGIRAGKAYVEMGTDQTSLEKGLKAAETKVKAFGASVAKIGAGLGALGASITAPLVAAMNKFAESGSALAHMSERTGVSVEALSALGYAAKQSGTDMEGVEIGIRRMQKAMTAGSLENIQAQQTFMKLGLSIKDIMRLNPDEQFNVMAKRIAAIRDPTARAGAAMMIFGKSGTSLLPMIMNMDKLTNEAEKFGLVTSTEAAEGALKLEHSMKLLEAITSKIVGTAGSALVPMFEQWNATLADIGKRVKDFVAANKPLIVTIANVGFALTAAGTAFIALGAVIAGMGATLGLISSAVGVLVGALGLLTTPLGAVVVGFVGMTAAMGKTNEAISITTKFMKDNFGDMFDAAKITFRGIADAMSAGDIQLASQILWAGLKVEWLQGTQYISGLWSEINKTGVNAFTLLKNSTISVLNELWAWIASNSVKTAVGISAAFESVWPNIKIGFAIVTTFIKDAWGDLLSFMPKPLISFAGFIFDVFNKIKGVITGSFLDVKKFGKELMEADEAFKQATNPEELAKQKAGRHAAIGQMQEERDRAADVRNKERDEVLAEIERNRKATFEGLQEDLNRQLMGKGKEENPRLIQAQKELDEAKRKLADLATNAKVLALGGAREIPEISGKGKTSQEGEPLTPEGLDKAMENQKAKIDVAGTFQAASAAGLGAGKSVANEQLKEQKKTNNHLEKLNHQVQVSKPVFS